MKIWPPKGSKQLKTPLGGMMVMYLPKFLKILGLGAPSLQVKTNNFKMLLISTNRRFVEKFLVMRSQRVTLRWALKPIPQGFGPQ